MNPFQATDAAGDEKGALPESEALLEDALSHLEDTNGLAILVALFTAVRGAALVLRTIGLATQPAMQTEQSGGMVALLVGTHGICGLLYLCTAFAAAASAFYGQQAQEHHERLPLAFRYASWTWVALAGAVMSESIVSVLLLL